MNPNLLSQLLMLACSLFINLNMVIGMYGLVGESMESNNKGMCIFASFCFVFFSLFTVLSVIIISFDIYGVL